MSDLFSERLKSLRGSKSKSEFARLLGLTAQVYQRYEDGRVPRADTLSVIAERLNVSVRWLLSGEEVSPNGVTDSGLEAASRQGERVAIREDRDDAYGSPSSLRRENSELRERISASERREAELLAIIRNLTAPAVAKGAADKS